VRGLLFRRCSVRPHGQPPVRLPSAVVSAGGEGE